MCSPPSTRPCKPSYTPNTSSPASSAVRTTARTAAFIPAESPPLVSTASLDGTGANLCQWESAAPADASVAPDLGGPAQGCAQDRPGERAVEAAVERAAGRGGGAMHRVAGDRLGEGVA